MSYCEHCNEALVVCNCDEGCGCHHEEEAVEDVIYEKIEPDMLELIDALFESVGYEVYYIEQTKSYYAKPKDR